jgi:nucleoside-diphosphate-sugar epimerase
MAIRLAARLRERVGRVFGLARTAEEAARLQGRGVEPVVADLAEPASLAAMPEVDLAFHVGGPEDGLGEAATRAYVDRLRALVGLFDRRGVGAFVYASSTAVYGHRNGSWVDESSYTSPRSSCGRLHLEAEELLLEAFRRSLFPAVIVRLAPAYGAGDRYFRQIQAGTFRLAGNGDAWMSLVHIEDGVRALLGAAARGRAGQQYLVSDDRPATVKELAYYVAGQLGVPRPIPVALEEARRIYDEITYDALTANFRCRNGRMKTELGVALGFPTYKEGIPAVLGRR